MELYQVLFTFTFLQIFSIKIFLITLFTVLMSKHLYKKYIINYEIKGQHKSLTKICNYPINIYNNLASYNYNNKPCLFIIKYYNKVNYYYLLVFDEILYMSSDILLGLISELMDKMGSTKKNQTNKKEINNNEMINNLFNSMIQMIPKNDDIGSKDGTHRPNPAFGHRPPILARSSSDNNKLLNMIKKENKISISDIINTKCIDESDTESDENNKFTLLDNIDLNKIDEIELNELNTKLVSVKDSLIKEINEMKN